MTGELKEAGRTRKAELAVGRPEEIGRSGELMTALLLFWSDFLQALSLAATHFSCCFSFFNRLVLF